VKRAQSGVAVHYAQQKYPRRSFGAFGRKSWKKSVENFAENTQNCAAGIA
jgi:hypothetical protein